MKNPLVSIIIPVYNGSNYLKVAIDSALSQSYKNIEIIVINDGSNDGGKTERIAKSYGNKIRYTSKKRGGVASALNFGIQKMQGEWFSWLSHDDVYMRDKISSQVEYLYKHPQCNIMYSEFELIDRHGKKIGRSSVGVRANENMYLRLLDSYPIHGCSMLISKKCFRGYLFNPKLPTTQDYDLWFRLSKKYIFYYQKKITIKSRIHKEQGSQTNKHKGEADNLYVKYINLITKNDLKNISNQSKWLANLAIRFSNYGYGKAAQETIKIIKKYKYPLSIHTITASLYTFLPPRVCNLLYSATEKLENKIYRLYAKVVRKEIVA